jgi:16S rRNA (uracil1498-N3)-methyltransferase
MPTLRHDNPRLIIPRVARRIHVSKLSIGELPLDARESHHARDVLRLPEGESVEVFDDAGATAQATLMFHGSHEATVRVESIQEPRHSSLNLIMASAIPKGARADWMIEKLSELGTAAFIPLATARSVVLPEGQQKRQRWERIAAEAAKQSRRAGVMRIEPLIKLEDLARDVKDKNGVAWFCSTTPPAMPIADAVKRLRENVQIKALTIAIGPEGGWIDAEVALLNQSQFTAVTLTENVLRVETAAIAAAATIKTSLQIARTVSGSASD